MIAAAVSLLAVLWHQPSVISPPQTAAAAAAAPDSVLDILQKDPSPELIPTSQIPADYKPYGITVGSSSGFNFLSAMMASMVQVGDNGSSDTKSTMRILKYLTVSWTNGTEVRAGGQTYLVAYQADTDLMSGLSATSPGGKLAGLTWHKTFLNESLLASVTPMPGYSVQDLQKIEGDLSSSEQDAHPEALSNIKQIGLATMIYSSDFNDKLPAADSTAKAEDEIYPYIKNRDLFKYRNPNGGQILYNTKLSGVNVTKVPKPVETVMWYDEKPWPDGKMLVCYLDGHVSFTDAKTFQAQLKMSQSLSRSVSSPSAAGKKPPKKKK